MNNTDICNQILDLIAKDDGLCEQFAEALGMEFRDFEDFLNTTQVSLTIDPTQE